VEVPSLPDPYRARCYGPTTRPRKYLFSAPVPIPMAATTVAMGTKLLTLWHRFRDMPLRCGGAFSGNVKKSIPPVRTDCAFDRLPSTWSDVLNNASSSATGKDQVTVALSPVEPSHSEPVCPWRGSYGRLADRREVYGTRAERVHADYPFLAMNRHELRYVNSTLNSAGTLIG
jgi:hypothetical protein